MKYKSKKEFLDSVVDNYSDQKEFHQAVEEVIHSIWNTAANNEEYCKFNILDRIVVPAVSYTHLTLPTIYSV